MLALLQDLDSQTSSKFFFISLKKKSAPLPGGNAQIQRGIWELFCFSHVLKFNAKNYCSDLLQTRAWIEEGDSPTVSVHIFLCFFLRIPKFQEFYSSGTNRLKGINQIFVTYIYSFSVVLFWYEESCLPGLLKMINLLFI